MDRDKNQQNNPQPFDPTTLGFNSIEELKAFIEAQRKKEGDFTKILEAKEREFQKVLCAIVEKISCRFVKHNNCYPSFREKLFFSS